MTAYRIQLATYRAKARQCREPVFRATVLAGDVPIATTIRAWPENAGCGRAAAIREASQVISTLEWQDRESAPLSMKSLKSLQSEPFGSKAGVIMLWLFAAWYLAAAIIGGCK